MAMKSISGASRGDYVQRAVIKKRGRGKLAGRYCVSTNVMKAPRSAVRGVKLKAVEMHGCFVSVAKAERKARSLVKRVRP